ncbi:general substrate transporter [Mollisia scopiformis]|uniref:General substrate transporter n=1 Tax=Mollisia scopiformis TaxID=149040 RepID=A0A194XGS1_MOLSC|nr:general substrate transporter [Mollisia scopiformis]KUJ19368.1 general substrate transporter [Mollisia scopiformis]
MKTLDEVAGKHVENKRQFNLYNVIMVIAMSLGALSYGYSTAIIGPTLGNSLHLGTVVWKMLILQGLYSTGGFLACYTVPYVADKWGRKWAVCSTYTLVSGAFLAGSTNIGEFIFFRFMAGAGAFSLLAAVPIWVNEVVPPRNRGAFITLMGLMLLLGYMFASWGSYGFYFYHPSSNNQWRPMLALQCLPPIILISIMPFLPESPRWLVKNNRITDAEKVLLKLHEPEEAKIEMRQITLQLEREKGLETSWYAMLWGKKSYRVRSAVAFGTTSFIQFSGILVINIFGPQIYGGLGYGLSTQLMLAACWVTVAFVSSFLSMFVVDRVSRPKMMAGGMIGCVCILITETVLVARDKVGPGENKDALKAAVAMIFLYVACYEWMNNVQLSYLGEIFPFHLRAKGLSLGVSGIALLNIIWLQAAPTALKNIGWKYYLCFIIPSALAAGVILRWFPDTRGLSLEECARVFGDEVELFGGKQGGEEAVVVGDGGGEAVGAGSEESGGKENA